MEKKFNDKIDALEKKFDTKFDELNKKVNHNSVNIIKVLGTISKMEKNIADLRDDFYTVYDLETDTHRHLKLN